MIRLAASELLRARSRRLVWVITLAAAAAIVIGLTIATVNTHAPSASDEASAERMYQQELARCLKGRYVPQGQVPPEYADLEAFCDDQVRLDYFRRTDGIRLSGLDGLIQSLATLTALVGVVIAASLVGADWSAGSMATLLTWEPRRVAVFAVRALVIALTVFVVSVGLLTWFAVLFRAAVALRGTAAGSEGWLGDVAGSILRIGAVAVLFGWAAYALASIGRSTAAGLGVMLAELVLVEGFLRGFRPSIERWLAVPNAVTFVSGEPRLGSLSQDPASVGAAALTLTGYAVAALVVAALAFRARDVS